MCDQFYALGYCPMIECDLHCRPFSECSDCSWFLSVLETSDEDISSFPLVERTSLADLSDDKFDELVDKHDQSLLDWHLSGEAHPPDNEYDDLSNLSDDEYYDLISLFPD